VARFGKLLLLFTNACVDVDCLSLN